MIEQESALFNAYIRSVIQLCPGISHTAIAYLQQGLSLTELKPKAFYIQAHVVQRNIGFVYRGLIRSFYVDPAGREINVNFISENKYATHYTSFITRTPGKYYLQCLEPTVIINLSYNHIQEGYSRYPILERYGRLVAEEVLKFQQKRIESFLFETAEQRYLNFVKEQPELLSRVSLSHLSSYLGIERQTLTRIRKKLPRQGF
jgi:CRP-like cAMP-binding protein